VSGGDLYHEYESSEANLRKHPILPATARYPSVDLGEHIVSIAGSWHITPHWGSVRLGRLPLKFRL